MVSLPKRDFRSCYEYQYIDNIENRPLHLQRKENILEQFALFEGKEDLMKVIINLLVSQPFLSILYSI